MTMNSSSLNEESAVSVSLWDPRIRVRKSVASNGATKIMTSVASNSNPLNVKIIVLFLNKN